MERNNQPLADAIVEDCEQLLGFARQNLAALSDKDGHLLAMLYDQPHRDKVYVMLKKLVEDLKCCQTAEDLPGPHATVLKLREESFRVFAGIFERVGDPIFLSTYFLEGARDFFEMLLTRDFTVVHMTKRASIFGFSLFVLRIALRVCHFQLTGQTWVKGFLNAHFSEDPVEQGEDFGNAAKATRARKTEWTHREIEAVKARAAKLSTRPELVAADVWKENEAEYLAASFLHACRRGFKSAAALRAHFACS